MERIVWRKNVRALQIQDWAFRITSITVVHEKSAFSWKAHHQHLIALNSEVSPLILVFRLLYIAIERVKIHARQELYLWGWSKEGNVVVPQVWNTGCTWHSERSLENSCIFHSDFLLSVFWRGAERVHCWLKCGNLRTNKPMQTQRQMQVKEVSKIMSESSYNHYRICLSYPNRNQHSTQSIIQLSDTDSHWSVPKKFMSVIRCVCRKPKPSSSLQQSWTRIYQKSHTYGLFPLIFSFSLCH